MLEERLKEIEDLQGEVWAVPGKEGDFVDLVYELTSEVRRLQEVEVRLLPVEKAWRQEGAEVRRLQAENETCIREWREAYGRVQARETSLRDKVLQLQDTLNLREVELVHALEEVKRVGEERG